MIILDGEVVSFIKFSDGCENLKLNVIPRPSNKHIIYVKWEDCTVDLVRLLLTVDALKRVVDYPTITLFMPYIPNARADRVFELGNALPLKVFGDMINSCGFNEVIVSDPHSEVSTSIINNCVVTEQQYLIEPQVKLLIKDGYVLCSPDEGASKKISKFKVPYIQATKKRDLITGKVVETSVDILGNKNIVIIDDICDGGGTFIALAKLLKEQGAENIILHVTHGIFSKGLDCLGEYIDKVYCSNIICNYVTQHDINKFNERK